MPHTNERCLHDVSIEDRCATCDELFGGAPSHMATGSVTQDGAGGVQMNGATSRVPRTGFERLYDDLQRLYPDGDGFAQPCTADFDALRRSIPPLPRRGGVHSTPMPLRARIKLSLYELAMPYIERAVLRLRATHGLLLRWRARAEGADLLEVDLFEEDGPMSTGIFSGPLSPP